MPALHFYADGSGHPDYRPPVERGDTDHYCLAAILVNDAQREQLEGTADRILRKYFPSREPRTVELKASWIAANVHSRPPWDTLLGPRHAELFDDIRDLLLDAKPMLLGQVVNKESYRLAIKASRPERPATNALRFMMARLNHCLDELSQEATATLDSDSRAMQEAQLELEASVRLDGDKIVGGGWTPTAVTRLERIHPIQHLNSNQSRCLQMADYVAHWLWQAAEYGKANRLRELDSLWRIIRGRREPWLGYLSPDRARLINPTQC
jgi:Protein of unknown function (DUF3800)